ncbi:MAG: hypothetical protein HY717_14895 [Planctomycetes bacterium]|nr:hypothetical protein [Planctomycetota bacterium]
MRTCLSIGCTALGLAAVYLFACGALPDLAAGGWDWEAGLQHALRPLFQADLFSLLALNLGFLCLALGTITAPRSEVWLAFWGGGKERDCYPVPLPQALKASARDGVLQVFLVFIVLMAAVLLILAGLSLEQGRSPEVLGALFGGAAVEVAAGLFIAARLLFSKRPSPRRFRPVFALSAGILAAEGLLMALVLGFGFWA